MHRIVSTPSFISVVSQYFLYFVAKEICNKMMLILMSTALLKKNFFNSLALSACFIDYSAWWFNPHRRRYIWTPLSRFAILRAAKKSRERPDEEGRLLKKEANEKSRIKINIEKLWYRAVGRGGCQIGRLRLVVSAPSYMFISSYCASWSDENIPDDSYNIENLNVCCISSGTRCNSLNSNNVHLCISGQ